MASSTDSVRRLINDVINHVTVDVLLCTVALHTAAAPASEVEAVVRSPTNMAAAEIAAVDFNKMSLDRPAAAMLVGEDLLANRRLRTLLLLIGRKKSIEYLI